MNPQAAQNYLRAKILTATPEQLQLMLYDGVIRFAEQGKQAILKKDYETTYNCLSRAQKIITELTCALKPEVAPDLCRNLSGIYSYCYKKIIDASIQHDVAALDEAINLLKYQRETWALLLEKLGKNKAAVAATKIDMPAPDSRMETSISMQG